MSLCAQEIKDSLFLPQVLDAVFEKFMRPSGSCLSKWERKRFFEALCALLDKEVISRALDIVDRWIFNRYYTMDRQYSIFVICSKRRDSELVCLMNKVNYCKCNYFQTCVLQLRGNAEILGQPSSCNDNQQTNGKAEEYAQPPIVDEGSAGVSSKLNYAHMQKFQGSWIRPGSITDPNSTLRYDSDQLSSSERTGGDQPKRVVQEEAGENFKLRKLNCNADQSVQATWIGSCADSLTESTRSYNDDQSSSSKIAECSKPSNAIKESTCAISSLRKLNYDTIQKVQGTWMRTGPKGGLGVNTIIQKFQGKRVHPASNSNALSYNDDQPSTSKSVDLTDNPQIAAGAYPTDSNLLKSLNYDTIQSVQGTWLLPNYTPREAARKGIHNGSGSYTCEHILALRLYQLFQRNFRDHDVTPEQFNYLQCGLLDVLDPDEWEGL